MCLYQVLMDLSGLVKPSATLSFSGTCTVATSRCWIPSLSTSTRQSVHTERRTEPVSLPAKMVDAESRLSGVGCGCGMSISCSNPRCGATLRDFYFETKAEDLPPARLLAPGTPSPAASGGDAKGKVKGSFGASSGRAALKVKNGGVSKPSSGAKRGSGSNASTPLNARDSLGGFLGLDSIRKTLKLEPNSTSGG